MMEQLKQAGMIVVLVLLSEGLFVIYSAFGHRDPLGNRLTSQRQQPSGLRRTTGGKGEMTVVELLAGATLCSSGLMLLYSLGTRDEK
jgi:hypothetical protein